MGGAEKHAEPWFETTEGLQTGVGGVPDGVPYGWLGGPTLSCQRLTLRVSALVRLTLRVSAHMGG